MKLSKKEKLCNEIIIQKLFKEGQAEFLYPFRLVYLSHLEPSEQFPQIVISVSRRNFRKAVERNWIRRRIREVYRLHKLKLQNSEKKFAIAYLGIMYVAKEKMAFNELEKKFIRLTQRFQ